VKINKVENAAKKIGHIKHLSNGLLIYCTLYCVKVLSNIHSFKTTLSMKLPPYINKLTKLGRCDRYTIEGLIIGLLGLLGL